jgi:hypothetical protein
MMQEYQGNQQETGLRLIVHNRTGEFHMIVKRIAICVTALMIATLASHLAQAAGKGSPNLGASTASPGHTKDPGNSGNTPGDVKNETRTKDPGKSGTSHGDVKNDAKK